METHKRKKGCVCFISEWRNEEIDQYFKALKQLLLDTLEKVSGLVFTLRVCFGHQTKLPKRNTALSRP